MAEDHLVEVALTTLRFVSCCGSGDAAGG